ncbi:MAG: ATP:cob(I)alamin adenosyltransferase [Prevotella sp.]|nr:ATP:cob(I)alamin adenosyltransferase [Prevotella sp.]
MKVYTRTGDEGTTSLANGMRVSKADARVSAVGALDELNAHIGYAGFDADR